MSQPGGLDGGWHVGSTSRSQKDSLCTYFTDIFSFVKAVLAVPSLNSKNAPLATKRIAHINSAKYMAFILLIVSPRIELKTVFSLFKLHERKRIISS